MWHASSLGGGPLFPPPWQIMTAPAAMVASAAMMLWPRQKTSGDRLPVVRAGTGAELARSFSATPGVHSAAEVANNTRASPAPLKALRSKEVTSAHRGKMADQNGPTPLQMSVHRNSCSPRRPCFSRSATLAVRPPPLTCNSSSKPRPLSKRPATQCSPTPCPSSVVEGLEGHQTPAHAAPRFDSSSALSPCWDHRRQRLCCSLKRQIQDSRRAPLLPPACP